jgi:hypothetical protein
MDPIESDPREHAATRAWLSLYPGQSLPRHIVELKPVGGKSAVYRLEGTETDGGTVIAKRCAIATIAVERTVYERILPHVPYPTLRFYGAVDDPGGEVGWIFVDDARGIPYSNENAEHRLLAAEWLAIFHTSAEGPPRTTALPDRGLAYHLENLRSAYAVLKASTANPALDTSSMALVKAVLSYCQMLESRWDMIQGPLEGMPQTVVHGGFYGKNVHIANRDGRPVVQAFDWESAGWGAPVLDLVRQDLAEYWSRVHAHWPNLTMQALQRSVEVGTMLWVLKAIPGEASSLSGPWANKVMGKLAYYCGEMQVSFERLGWQS